MALFLFIPGFPGKSSESGHSGEVDLLSFQPRSGRLSGKAASATGPRFVVTLDQDLNTDFVYRVLLASQVEMIIPLVWVSVSPQYKYMFWNVKVPKENSVSQEAHGSITTITFEYGGSTGYYT